MHRAQPKISRKLILLFMLLLFPLMLLGTLIFQFNAAKLKSSIAAVTQQSVDSCCQDLEQTVDGITAPVTLSMRGTQTGVQVDVTVPKSLLHQSIRSILTAIWLLVGTAFLGGLALVGLMLFLPAGTWVYPRA